MQPAIKSFFDLDSWQQARALTRHIYKESESFPKHELFGLTSQMRRASVSVQANIAEGFGRASIKEKIHFYTQAHGSLTELQSHLFVATDLNYLSQDKLVELQNISTRVQSVLNGLLRSTRKRL